MRITRDYSLYVADFSSGDNGLMLKSHSGRQPICDTDRHETQQEEMQEAKKEEDNEKQGK